jgi:hypothetical protein
MGASQQGYPMPIQSAEILTLEQIQLRYDGEWVLIAYTEIDHNLKPIRGEVLAHSSDRDAVYGAVPQGEGRDLAIECFVKAPMDFLM